MRLPGRRTITARRPGEPSDRGAATAELVVAIPLLLLLLLGIVQFAVAEHAEHIAQAVADRALAVARTEGATAGDGRNEASAQLAALAGGSLRNPQIDVTRDADRVHVDISGVATAVIPGVHLHVSAQADGSVEQFTTPTASGG